MNKIKTFFRKAKYTISHGLFSIENVVLIIAVVLCLTWTFQSIIAMSRNWELSERLADEKRQLEILNIEVESAELENDYYKTSEYQELAARRHLDKKLNGENMVIMPENSAAAKEKFKSTPFSEISKNYSNFERWLKFLFPSY